MNNNTFYRTFSGADALAFMIFPETQPILLGSLTTISYSMYRDKKPVTLVGTINVSGFTRGMRVIAGSLVFTLINQHLTKDVAEQIPYIKAHSKVKADELPPFDIMVVCANEYGQTTRMMIYGIDITDDSQVLSVEDLYTENTFNFVARDVDEFTEYKETSYATGHNSGANYNNARTVGATTFGFDMLYSRSAPIDQTTDLFHEVQRHLYNIGYLKTISNVYDNETVNAIKSIQKQNHITSNGVLDETTFNIIFATREVNETAEVYLVTNHNGANLYLDREKKLKSYNLNYNTKVHISFDTFGEMITKVNGIDMYISSNDLMLCKPYQVAFERIGVSEEQSRTIYELEHIGVIVKDKSFDKIKCSCVSVYPDGAKKHFSIIHNDLTNIDIITLRDLSESYIYDIDHNAFPEYLYYNIQIKDLFYRWKVRLIVE